MPLIWWALAGTALVVGIMAAPSGPAAPSIRVATTTSVFHPPVQIASSKNGLTSSTNWAGYAVTGATFTSITASWVQPAVTCPTNQQQDAAFWVGIDGFQKGSNTVEQTGTDSDCNKGSKKKPGGPTYYAWWELFPAGSNNLSTASFPVGPGDTMTATVNGSGTTFNLTIQDVSRGWTFSTPALTASGATGSSAEWITEAPSICKGSACNTSKLADFGLVSFTNAAADGAPVSSALFTQNQIDMMKGKKTVKAATSSITGGTSFNVVWHHN
jgi:hypothetical protein